MSEPIPVQITRFRCPSCSRMSSSRSRAREHMTRCWFDPVNRGCKTCALFYRDAEWADGCAANVDLSGHPACAKCDGAGFLLGVADECSTCKDVPEVRDVLKPGPIIHCDLWQARDEETDDA